MVESDLRVSAIPAMGGGGANYAEPQLEYIQQLMMGYLAQD